MLLSNCSNNENVSFRESEQEFVRLEKILPATVYYFRILVKTIAGYGVTADSVPNNNMVLISLHFGINYS
jgi:hypothetical protein